MSIKDLPLESRPRERLQRLGAGALSDAELLAVLLRTGVPGTSALVLADQLLARFGGIRGLLSAPWEEWQKVRGLGAVKRGQILASLELVRRMLRETMAAAPVFTTSDAVRSYLQLRLINYRHEVFLALWLDNQHRLISDQLLFEGTLHEAAIYPREVVKQALACHASAVLFAHNHPAGCSPLASTHDESITEKLITALSLVDVRVLDHCIVAGNQVSSMAEQGFSFRGTGGRGQETV